MLKLFITLLFALAGYFAFAQNKKIEFADVKGLMPAQPYGYSEVVSAPLSGTLLMLSGQTSWDSASNIIGKGNFKQQVEESLRLVEKILLSKGAKKPKL